MSARSTRGNMEIYGLPDLCALPSTTFTAESEASVDYPATRLSSEVPTDTWRSLGYSPIKTVFQAVSAYEGGQLEFGVGGMGLVNHNLWPWTGEVRFLLQQGATPSGLTDFFDIIVPTGVVSQTNCSVTIGDIDNGFTPAGGAVGPSSLVGTPFSFLLSFPSPSDTLQIGHHRQLFAIYAGQGLTTTVPSESPTITVSLYEAGVLVRSIARKAICSSTPQWYLFPWDAEDLADLSGADVQIHVIGTVNSAPSPERYPIVDEVLWLCERDHAVASAPGVLHDSGWIPAGKYIGNPRETEKYLPAELTEGDCVSHNVNSLDAAVREVAGVNMIRVLIREDHSPDLDTYNITTFPVVPPGYVEVGHLVAGGSVFVTDITFAVGPADGIRDLSSTKFTQGGQQYGQRNGVLRTAQVDFFALTIAEKAFITDRILRRRGVSRPLLISLMPADPLEAEALTFYATLSQQETSAMTQLIDDYRRRLSISLLEYR